MTGTLATDDGDDVGHGAAVTHPIPAPLGRGRQLVSGEQLVEHGFLDDMLRTDLSSGETAVADPSPDGFGVLPCPLRRFRYGIIARYYYRVSQKEGVTPTRIGRRGLLSDEDEARCVEVAVQSESPTDAQLAHELEAGPIHERYGAPDRIPVRLRRAGPQTLVDVHHPQGR